MPHFPKFLYNTDYLSFSEVSQKKHLYVFMGGVQKVKKGLIFIRNITLIGLLIALHSCTADDIQNKAVLRACSLTGTRPDSALIILQGINPTTLTQARDRAAYKLHLYHALYKTTSTPPPDSLITDAKSYYEKTRLEYPKALAFYLYACSRELDNKPDSALFWYKQAALILENTGHHDLHGLVLYNLSYLNSMQERYVPARDYLHQAVKKFRQSGNRKYLAYAYRDLAHIAHTTGMSPGEVLKTHRLAMQLAKQCGDTVNYEYMQAQLGEYLAEVDPRESKDLILGYLKKHPQENLRFTAYLATIYYSLHQSDSAAYYLRLTRTSLHTQRNRMLYYVASVYAEREMGNFRGAFSNLEKAYYLRDSIFTENMNNHLYEIDRKFDLNTKEKENLELKIENRNKIIYIGLLLLALLIFLIIFFTISNRHKRLQIKKSLEQENMQLRLEAIHAINDKKKELMYNKLHVRTQNTLNLRKFEQGMKDKNKQEEFIRNAYRQLIINEEEWNEYFRELDHLLDHQLSNFCREYHEITNWDKRIIMLIVLKCDIADCCTLFNLSKNTLYHRRSILRERLNLSKDTDLDAWLIETLTPPTPSPS